MSLAQQKFLNAPRGSIHSSFTLKLEEHMEFPSEGVQKHQLFQVIQCPRRKPNFHQKLRLQV